MPASTLLSRRPTAARRSVAIGFTICVAIRPTRAAGPWSAAGIYLDGVRPHLGCPGYRFEENVVYRTDNPLFFNKWPREGNTWQDNWFQKDAPPKEKLQAIAAEAGLEAAYRQKLADSPL